jgi:hypothetical protein
LLIEFIEALTILPVEAYPALNSSPRAEIARRTVKDAVMQASVRPLLCHLFSATVKKAQRLIQCPNFNHVYCIQPTPILTKRNYGAVQLSRSIAKLEIGAARLLSAPYAIGKFFGKRRRGGRNLAKQSNNERREPRRLKAARFKRRDSRCRSMEAAELHAQETAARMRLNTLRVFVEEQGAALNSVLDNDAKRMKERLIRSSDSPLQCVAHVRIRPAAVVPHDACDKSSGRHAVLLRSAAYAFGENASDRRHRSQRNFLVGAGMDQVGYQHNVLPGLIVHA